MRTTLRLAARRSPLAAAAAHAQDAAARHQDPRRLARRPTRPAHRRCAPAGRTPASPRAACASSAHVDRPDGFFNPANIGDFALLRTPTSRSAATTCSRAASTASRSGTSPTRPPRAARRARLPRRPGRRVGARQPALHVGRGDARPRGLRRAGRHRHGERRALPRRAHLRHQRRRRGRGRSRAVQTCRGSHTHTLVPDPRDPTQRVRVRLRHERRALAERARGLLRRRRPPRTRTRRCFRIEVIRVPLAAPAGRAHRRARRASSPTRRGNPAGLQPGGRSDSRHAARRRRRTSATTSPSTRELGLGGRRVRGQRHPARHQRPGEPAARRRGERPELRLLALGDVQQRRHARCSSPTSGAAARSRAAARPTGPSGAPTRSSRSTGTSMRPAGYYKLPAAQTADRELRGAQRLADPGAGARHHGAGVVPGRPLDLRLHRPVEAAGDRVLRPRADARATALEARRLLVGVLVQRPHLRHRDRARPRRARADAERDAVAERDRRREARCAGRRSTRRRSRGHVAGERSSSRARTSTSSRAATSSQRACVLVGDARPGRGRAR